MTTEITTEERAEIDSAVERGEIMSDALLAKRLLAAESATEKPRKGLSTALAKIAAPDAKPDGSSSAAEKPINRQTVNAWWCPFCDHSQTTLLAECGGCGAVRDGDTVTKAQT
jgi:hypothetical protein